MPLRAALPVVLALLATAAAAQHEGWTLPNPLQGGNVAATCDNWPAQQQSADRRR